MASPKGASRPGNRTRVVELDIIYGAMLDCLAPEAADRPDDGWADRGSYRVARALSQTTPALWLPQPAF